MADDRLCVQKERGGQPIFAKAARKHAVTVQDNRRSCGQGMTREEIVQGLRFTFHRDHQQSEARPKTLPDGEDLHQTLLARLAPTGEKLHDRHLPA